MTQDAIVWLEGQLKEFATSYPQFNLDAAAARSMLAKYIVRNMGQVDTPAKNVRLCDGCGTPFPRIGRAIYCPDCREKGVPDRERKRRYRANDPEYDKHYRARQIEKKGV